MVSSSTPNRIKHGDSPTPEAGTLRRRPLPRTAKTISQQRTSTGLGAKRKVASGANGDQHSLNEGQDSHVAHKRRMNGARSKPTNNANDKHAVKTPPAIRRYAAGDQVEAIKWIDGKKVWHCARVVTMGIQGDDSPPRVFVHYEGWSPDHADWVSLSSIRAPSADAVLRYGPRGEESELSWESFSSFHRSQEAESLVKHHTGLVQDRRMLLHTCPCHSKKTVHPERPDRIVSILQTLHDDRLLRYFQRIEAREATLEELLKAHTATHIGNYCSVDPASIEKAIHRHNTDETHPTTNNSNNNTMSDHLHTASNYNPPSPSTATRRTHGVAGGEVIKVDGDQIRKKQCRISSAAATEAALEAAQYGPPTVVIPPGLIYEMTCGELGIAVDTPFHPLYSSTSARVSAGALMELVDKVVQKELHNGFALIRPPGHHAEQDAAMGFCFFNNVAVAASYTLVKHPSIRKILIIDWDIHHGNGTQKIFYDNPNVLYISIHRWDNGHFYPFSGAPEECGEGQGLGRNVNIPFSASSVKPKPMGDVEFLAAFYHIVLPIASQFAPDMIFVSAGFDAAAGHPANIGGYRVTPRGFAMMTRLTKDFAEAVCDGRLVMSLEGGYELEPLAHSVSATVEQLLSDKLNLAHRHIQFNASQSTIKPNHGAIESMRRVVAIQKQYWHFPEETLDPNFRFLLPDAWRAKNSIATRPRRRIKTSGSSHPGY